MIFKLLLIGMITIANCWLFGGRDCDEFHSCTECVTHDSWSGKPCRWCPRDNRCHAHASLQNKCSKTENIKNINNCDRKISEFDEDEAWKMLQLSAAAYSSSPENCFSAIANSDFQLYGETVYENCPRSTVCFAFTAISHVRKAIVVAYRGSVDADQVIAQILENLVNFKKDIGDGSIYSYYYDAYEAFKPCILTRIQELRSLYDDYTVYFTGHSLGGAIASVTSTMLTMLGYIPRDKVKLITFGQPRVGTYLAAATHDRNVHYSFRVTHAADLVVHYPTCLHLPGVTGCIGASMHKFPYHHGKEVFYRSSMTVGKNLYKVCNGKPFNEDTTCADGTLEPLYSIADHKNYYNVYVSKYGESGCGRGRLRRKRSDFEEYDPENPFAGLNRTMVGNVSDPETNVTLTCRIFNITNVNMVKNFLQNDRSKGKSWIVAVVVVGIIIICGSLGALLWHYKKKQKRDLYATVDNLDL